jgi:hypothetical protein
VRVWPDDGVIKTRKITAKQRKEGLEQSRVLRVWRSRPRLGCELAPRSKAMGKAGPSLVSLFEAG